MNLNLGDEWDHYVREKVDSGFYQSNSEVIREGLRLLREKDILFHERLKRLGCEIDKGFDQADSGDFVDPQEVRRHIQNNSNSIRMGMSA